MSSDIITYELDAGSYPYRVDGLRLDASEARIYLRERKGVKLGAADAAVELARVDAVHAAGAPALRLTRLVDCTKFMIRYFAINGGRELTESETRQVLTAEYRYTPTEVDALLKTAAS